MKQADSNSSDAAWSIGQAADRHCTDLEKIAEDAYTRYVPRMDRKPFPMLDDYRRHIRNGSAFVLEAGGQVKGYVILLPQQDGSMLVDNIAVRPEAQNAGYGHALLDFAEKEARGRGFSRVTLYTNAVMHENVRWYERHGYSITRHGVERGYNRIYFSKDLAPAG